MCLLILVDFGGAGDLPSVYAGSRSSTYRFIMKSNDLNAMTREELIAEIATLRVLGDEYRLLLDESSDPIFAFFPDGEYRYVNRAFARGVGKKLEDIIGHKIWDVFSKDEADKRFAVVR
jgi:PAS domain-containing protein